jgi:predicted O-methyltransferase YrrM
MNKHQYAIREALSRTCEGAESYLEVGVNEGTSLEVVINECPTIKSLTLVDMWGKEYGGTGRGSNAHIKDLLNKLGYTGSVRFIDGNSHDILPQLISEGASFDLVTIDGDHSYEGGERDLIDGWQLLKSSGWLVFDDITHEQHSYLMEMTEKFEANYSPANSIWITDLINGAVAFQKA